MFAVGRQLLKNILVLSQTEFRRFWMLLRPIQSNRVVSTINVFSIPFSVRDRSVAFVLHQNPSRPGSTYSSGLNALRQISTGLDDFYCRNFQRQRVDPGWNISSSRHLFRNGSRKIKLITRVGNWERIMQRTALIRSWHLGRGNFVWHSVSTCLPTLGRRWLLVLSVNATSNLSNPPLSQVQSNTGLGAWWQGQCWAKIKCWTVGRILRYSRSFLPGDMRSCPHFPFLPRLYSSMTKPFCLTVIVNGRKMR